MIHADAHPSRVVGDIVDPIRRGTAQLGNHEVVHANFLGIPLRPPFPPIILEITHQLLLLGVHGNHRLAPLQVIANFLVDVLELLVAVGVAGPFQRFAVGLQAVTPFMQQLGDHPMAGLMPQPLEVFGQFPYALAGPAQRRLWIPTRHGIYQLLQIAFQGAVFVNRSLAPATSTAHSFHSLGRRFSQFLGAFDNRPTRHAGRSRHHRVAAETDRGTLGGREQPPHPLIQERFESLESSTNRQLVSHWVKYRTFPVKYVSVVS